MTVFLVIRNVYRSPIPLKIEAFPTTTPKTWKKLINDRICLPMYSRWRALGPRGDVPRGVDALNSLIWKARWISYSKSVRELYTRLSDYPYEPVVTEIFPSSSHRRRTATRPRFSNFFDDVPRGADALNQRIRKAIRISYWKTVRELYTRLSESEILTTFKSHLNGIFSHSYRGEWEFAVDGKNFILADIFVCFLKYSWFSCDLWYDSA